MKNIIYARHTMKRIGTQLVEEKKAAVRAAAADSESKAPLERDLLSILVRANMAAGAGQRMNDDDVLAQIPTFLVAGHETTSYVPSTPCGQPILINYIYPTGRQQHGLCIRSLSSRTFRHDFVRNLLQSPCPRPLLASVHRLARLRQRSCRN
jgi:hypothetical protein